jgi:hypothetical protein
MLNLLSNACKFTKEGEVRLRARRVFALLQAPVRRRSHAMRLKVRHKNQIDLTCVLGEVAEEASLCGPVHGTPSNCERLRRKQVPQDV